MQNHSSSSLRSAMNDMKHSLYQELWRLRFKKILKLEEEAALAYSRLLTEYMGDFDTRPNLKDHFVKLIRDEKKHVRLAKELLRILERQEV